MTESDREQHCGSSILRELSLAQQRGSILDARVRACDPGTCLPSVSYVPFCELGRRESQEIVLELGSLTGVDELVRGYWSLENAQLLGTREHQLESSRVGTVP